MNNFIFENKTKVYFGKGGVKEYLGSLLVNYGETVMLAYGGGSIKRNGVYDEIMGILNAAGKRVVEFDRIMPNPTYAKAQEEGWALSSKEPSSSILTFLIWAKCILPIFPYLRTRCGISLQAAQPRLPLQRLRPWWGSS